MDYTVSLDGRARATGSFQKSDMPSRVDKAKASKVEKEATWRAVCKAVDARDGKQCRCCDNRSDPDATGLLTRGHRHHIVYRSAGGRDESSNIVSLCSSCHNDEHKHRLLIEGNADERLTFWRKGDNETFHISREEIAVRVVRRD